MIATSEHMTNIAIRVENLSKMYRIGGPQEKYTTFRDVLARTATAPFRRAHDLLRGQAYGAAGLKEEIWALKDINFEVKHGEVVGIIGRNGAGKSTLLKVLSRITEPTTGIVDVYGRVGALLEVGTGFHAELTGRENVYLNGAILGMSRQDIDRKFDEIVDFAGVEKFIDTPVKHYSSGMGLRLGFAVAAHLEPETLIVDEVLAVGDAEFQKKCLTKMQEVGASGRTILFVSHNMSAIRNICKTAIVMNNGFMIASGETNKTIDDYLASFQQVQRAEQSKTVETPNFTIINCTVESIGETVTKTGKPIEVRVKFLPKVDIADPGLYIGFLTLEGQRLAGLDFKDFTSIPSIPAGQVTEMGFFIDSTPFLPGRYFLEVHLKDMAQHLFEVVPTSFPFEVVTTPVYGGRSLNKWFGSIKLAAQPIHM